MKATGIIRRVDDLGRVVIPKEIRKNLGIREGEALEIFVDTSSSHPMVCFAKYEQNLVGRACGLSEAVEDYYEGENKAEVMRALDAVVKLMRKGAQ